MKFSAETLDVLKGFSTINPGIIFQEGNTLRTISPQKDVMATAVVEDTFEGRAPIYDLSKFLACISTIGDADITFNEDHFLIKAGRAKSTYRYASENVVVAPPATDFGSQFSDQIVQVKLAWSDIDQAIRSASIFQLPDIAFTSSGDGKVKMSALDNEDPSTNSFDLDIGEDSDCDKFKVLLSVDNLKLMPADYVITLYAEGVAHFKSEKVEYWVAIKAKD